MPFLRISWFAYVVLLPACVLGCRHESSDTPLNLSNDAQSVPASPPGTASAVLVATPTTTPSADGGERPDVAPPTSSSVAAATAANPASAPPATEHAADSPSALLDAQGKPLPQTDQRPSSTSAAFQERIALVGEAILTGNTEPAAAAFFPLLAYQQVKDVAKPERDYRFRLLANFKRDVLEYHHALGAEAAQAKFSGVTVSERDAKWMAPGSEGNKVGYFRVLRSHLHFTLPTGRTRDFELTSLISWRGEWYVVHLHGFK